MNSNTDQVQAEVIFPGAYGQTETASGAGEVIRQTKSGAQPVRNVAGADMYTFSKGTSRAGAAPVGIAKCLQVF